MKIHMIGIRDLQAFVILAEELHFGRAAHRLGIAQPNLSTIIRRLEADAGAQLISRRPRVALTEAGKIMEQGAMQTLALLESTLALTQMAGEGKKGIVRGVFASTAIWNTMADVVRTFRERNPEVDLWLRDMHSSYQLEALRRGEADVAITREPGHDSAICRQLLTAECFEAVFPEDHPKALGTSPVDLSDLANEKFVMSRRQVAVALHDAILQLCKSAHFDPLVVQEADEWDTALGFVRAGFGITLAPESLSRIGWPGIRFRRLRDAPVRAELYCCWRRDPSPAAASFIEALTGAKWV
jgi:DNA-binding transcriptional LysR family regulator